jgi:hypothetical protein
MLKHHEVSLKGSNIGKVKKWTSIPIIFKVHHQTNAGPWV